MGCIQAQSVCHSFPAISTASPAYGEECAPDLGAHIDVIRQHRSNDHGQTSRVASCITASVASLEIAVQYSPTIWAQSEMDHSGS